MGTDFNLVKVNDINTSEMTDYNVVIDTSKFIGRKDELKACYLEHEIKVYDKIEKDLEDKVKINEKTSRRIICTYSPTDNSSDWCMSLFHLLLGRKENKLIVYIRSLNFDYYVSDLAFMINLALKHDAKILSVHIGSFHQEIKDE